MKEFFGDIFKTVKTISLFDFIDIIFVSVLFYYLYKFLKNRRAGKLAVGVISLIALKLIADLFDMYVIQYILQNVFQIGIIAIIIVFQPELRSALEKVGGQPLKGLKSIGDTRAEPIEKMIGEVSAAAADLGRTKTGALIVIERLTKLGDMILTGTVIDSEPSTFLIKNIFFNKAPLHDGALIIRDGRLHAAGCLLPLSSNEEIVKDLGTRHRAAIGMSENSDALVIVVSEETGVVSLAVEGVLYRGYTKETLEAELRRYLIHGSGKQQSIFTKRNKNKSDGTEGSDESER